MVTTVLHFLLNNGIGQNITAGVLIGAPMRVWAEVRVLRPLRRHHELVAALHARVVTPPGPPGSDTDQP